MKVGSDKFGYRVEDRWAKLPAGWSFVEVAGIATDSRDRVYVFNRGEHPVIVFDCDGNFMGSWGERAFKRPHGIFIGPDDSVYLVDDQDHTVRKFTSDGRLLLTLGVSGQPSDTGAVGNDYRTVQRGAPPFNFPTNLALSARGELYVSDGYGNCRMHKFSARGDLLFSWGEQGIGPGQFRLPHGVTVGPEGIVYVADRENSRIQLFTSEGKFAGQWTDVARPCQVFVDSDGYVYVAELGFRAGMWPGVSPPASNAPGGRVSIFDWEGKLQARWGGGENPCSPGDFFAPHDIWVDSRGDIYVGEVTMSAGGYRGMVPPDCHSLQKFARL